MDVHCQFLLAKTKYVPAFPYDNDARCSSLQGSPYCFTGTIGTETDLDFKGLVYTERLYRELYHLYDFENKWHITEVQIEIE